MKFIHQNDHSTQEYGRGKEGIPPEKIEVFWSSNQFPLRQTQSEHLNRCFSLQMLTFGFSVGEDDQVEPAGGGHVCTLDKSTWSGTASPLGQKECLGNIFFYIAQIHLQLVGTYESSVHVHLESNPGPDYGSPCMVYAYIKQILTGLTAYAPPFVANVR